MNKKILKLLFSIIICLMLCACTAKLTTIRPTLITRIEVEENSSGIKIKHTRKQNADLDNLMDELVLQMEKKYRHLGSCKNHHEHAFEASFYREEQLELQVLINWDGSICKDERLYTLKSDNDADIRVYIKNWEDFMAFEP